LGGDFSVEEIEAEHVRKVLARKQVLQEAASILQMDRKTLLRRRKDLKLE
jgi:NtrC-family two-component system response regulator AlgB